MKFPKINLKTLFLLFIFATVLFIFFSFRLADTPDGINEDEASYGYNAISLAENLRDQNGRRLPLFILGTDNQTWYPPYMQYLVAVLFRLFGPSVYVMRMATVLITVFSALLIFYFAKLLFDKKYAFVALLSFLIIPEVTIETHTPLEHMIVVPFVLLWLIGLFKYKKSLDSKYLILAGLSLGLGFYSYGGIRPLIPIWSLASVAYIAYLNWPSKKFSLNSFLKKSFLVPLLTFGLTALPFFAAIPILEFYYSGAVMNRVTFKIDSIYNFFYFYLTSFDLSFLFVTGDKLLIQSTLRHGMFLLSTLPIFAIGIFQAFRKKSDYLILLGIVFFASPILYGFVGSAYFAHRLLYMVPFYVIFVTLGVKEMITNKNRWLKYLSYVLFIIVIINFFDFWKYYMYQYPKDTAGIFHHLENYDKPYKELAREAKQKDLVPFLSPRVARMDGMNIGDPELFVRAIYFPRLPKILEEQTPLPDNGILLTDRDSVVGLKRLDTDARPFFIFVRE